MNRTLALSYLAEAASRSRCEDYAPSRYLDLHVYDDRRQSVLTGLLLRPGGTMLLEFDNGIETTLEPVESACDELLGLAVIYLYVH